MLATLSESSSKQLSNHVCPRPLNNDDMTIGIITFVKKNLQVRFELATVRRN